MKKSELQQRIENAERELAEAKALLAQQEKTKSRVVDSVKDIPGRNWFITAKGNVSDVSSDDLNQMSTKERAEAILALIQLIEIHAAIEQNETDKDFIRIISSNDRIISSNDRKRDVIFWFESIELEEEFKTKHKDLIETVRKGL
jgi:hypothetical protein